MTPQKLITYLEGMGASSALAIVSVLQNKRALDLLGIYQEFKLAGIEQDWDNERTIYHIESEGEVFRLTDENGHLFASGWELVA